MTLFRKHGVLLHKYITIKYNIHSVDRISFV